jgi:hypothetical protein
MNQLMGVPGSTWKLPIQNIVEGCSFLLVIDWSCLFGRNMDASIGSEVVTMFLTLHMLCSPLSCCRLMIWSGSVVSVGVIYEEWYCHLCFYQAVIPSCRQYDESACHSLQDFCFCHLHSWPFVVISLLADTFGLYILLLVISTLCPHMPSGMVLGYWNNLAWTFSDWFAGRSSGSVGDAK